MWTCPKCKHKFYNANQSHSCGSYTVDDFLKGKTKTAIDLFNFFISECKKIGKLDIHLVKTRVALLIKMRFCAINKIGADYIDVHLVFTKPFDDNLCFYKIDNLADRFFIHHLKIYNKPDVNSEVKKFMKLAYEIGNRKHVEEKKKTLMDLFLRQCNNVFNFQNRLVISFRCAVDHSKCKFSQRAYILRKESA